MSFPSIADTVLTEEDFGEIAFHVLLFKEAYAIGLQLLSGSILNLLPYQGMSVYGYLIS